MGEKMNPTCVDVDGVVYHICYPGCELRKVSQNEKQETVVECSEGYTLIDSPVCMPWLKSILGAYQESVASLRFLSEKHDLLCDEKQKIEKKMLDVLGNNTRMSKEVESHQAEVDVMRKETIKVKEENRKLWEELKGMKEFQKERSAFLKLREELERAKTSLLELKTENDRLRSLTRPPILGVDGDEGIVHVK